MYSMLLSDRTFCKKIIISKPVNICTVVPPLSSQQLSKRSVIHTVEVTVLLEYFA